MLRYAGLRRLAVAGAALFAMQGDLSAQVILSPVAGTIDSGGPGFGPLSDTFNQSGLSANFLSGATDFSTYVATNPTHTFLWDGYEWFSNGDLKSAMVTYDLGSVWSVSALALWNEEAAGIGVLDLLGSTNGIDFFSLALGLSPTDHPQNADYAANVFNFSAQDLRYVRFDMSDCPQPDNNFPGCAIGEVAFAADAAGQQVAPEPMTLLLLGTGLLGVGVVGRSRRRRVGSADVELA